MFIDDSYPKRNNGVFLNLCYSYFFGGHYALRMKTFKVFNLASFGLNCLKILLSIVLVMLNANQP